ncbi:MAG TPA: DUF177 domain-containing protein [Rhizomicrobium sp.]|jgi:uncharacterized metal-binding protein YceD (DUF177 family)
MTENPPLQREFDLGRLSEAGAEIVLAPTEEERAVLAQWADLCSVEAFKATVELRRKTLSSFHYEARIEADITQNCVVTLEPVASHLDKTFSRELHLTQTTRHAALEGEPLAPGMGDDDAPEEIDSPRYDVAAPVLEEFSLAIDPYPRAPGAAFESAPEAQAEADNPFAVLKRLKTGI